MNYYTLRAGSQSMFVLKTWDSAVEWGKKQKVSKHVLTWVQSHERVAVKHASAVVKHVCLAHVYIEK